MPLTDTAVKIAKPTDKPYRLTDGKGLYLIVNPTGRKYWRIDYRHDSKRQTLSAGIYPQTGLKAARAERDRIRDLLAAGLNPSLERRARAARDTGSETFEAIAREWHGKQAARWSASYAERVIKLLAHDLFPHLGALSLDAVTAPLLLAALRRMEGRGLTDSAHKAREIAGAVFRYGVATGRCTSDPAAALRGALAKHTPQHHAAVIDPREFGQLLRALDGYAGSCIVRAGLKLTPLLALRPGELRHLEWAEIDLAGQEIRIPAAKMKMASPHIVPLATQAVTILRELHPLTGHGRYVFPSARHPRGDRPMSENTVNAALRTLGYDGATVCAHGFRGSFCSLANEKLAFSPDAIERQLAHAERNKVRAAYLHTEFLPERRRLMQAWADFLDGLKLFSLGSEKNALLPVLSGFSG